MIRGQIHRRQARQQPSESLLPYDPPSATSPPPAPLPLQTTPAPAYYSDLSPRIAVETAPVACAVRHNCGPPPATATITNSACRRLQHRTPAPCLSNSTPQSSASSVSSASTHFCVLVPILSAPGPFQQEVSQTLRLKNPHSDPVAFKVSTLQSAADTPLCYARGSI